MGNGMAWQNSPVFTGLSSGTGYTFTARYTETTDGSYAPSPASEVAQYTTMERASGSGSSITRYAIHLPDEISGRSVTANYSRAAKGRVVVLAITPEDGFQLQEIAVRDSDGKAVKLSVTKTGYSFTMPGRAVTAEVRFVPEQDPQTWVNPFRDVKETDWFYEAVKLIHQRELMYGTESDTFLPEGKLSRGMAVTVLYRLAGSPDVMVEEFFSDVSLDDYCAQAGARASMSGISGGYSDDFFGPHGVVTREQLAVMLYRYAQSLGIGYTGAWLFPLEYTDTSSVSAYTLRPCVGCP